MRKEFLRRKINWENQRIKLTEKMNEYRNPFKITSFPFHFDRWANSKWILHEWIIFHLVSSSTDLSSVTNDRIISRLPLTHGLKLMSSCNDNFEMMKVIIASLLFVQTIQGRTESEIRIEELDPKEWIFGWRNLASRLWLCTPSHGSHLWLLCLCTATFPFSLSFIFFLFHSLSFSLMFLLIPPQTIIQLQQLLLD